MSILFPARTMVWLPNGKQPDYIACPMLGSRKPKGIGINTRLAIAPTQLEKGERQKELLRVDGRQHLP